MMFNQIRLSLIYDEYKYNCCNIWFYYYQSKSVKSIDNDLPIKLKKDRQKKVTKALIIALS